MHTHKTTLNTTRQAEGRKLRAALRSNLLYNHYLPAPAPRSLTRQSRSS